MTRAAGRGEGTAESYIVQAIAGSGEVVILPGDGHVLGRSDASITERLEEWLPAVLESAPPQVT